MGSNPALFCPEMTVDPVMAPQQNTLDLQKQHLTAYTVKLSSIVCFGYVQGFNRDVGRARKRTAKAPNKVMRRGSWNETARFAMSASRWRYAEYKPVYNVRFRTIVLVQD